MRDFKLNNAIQNFLYKNDMFWDGKCKNKNETLCGGMMLLDIGFDGEYHVHEFYLDVDDITFRLYQKKGTIKYEDITYMCKLYQDLSLEWIRFRKPSLPQLASMFEKSPNRAKMLKQDMQRNLTDIQNAQKELNATTEDHNSFYYKKYSNYTQQAISFWTPILELSQKVCANQDSLAEMEKRALNVEQEPENV